MWNGGGKAEAYPHRLGALRGCGQRRLGTHPQCPLARTTRAPLVRMLLEHAVQGAREQRQGVEGTGSIHTKNGPAAALGSRTRLGGWEQQRRSGGDEESRGLEGGVQGRRACVRG